MLIDKISIWKAQNLLYRIIHFNSDRFLSYSKRLRSYEQIHQ
jgi:hypothetical protein